jgi:hypothetical protein
MPVILEESRHQLAARLHVHEVEGVFGLTAAPQVMSLAKINSINEAPESVSIRILMATVMSD